MTKSRLLLRKFFTYHFNFYFILTKVWMFFLFSVNLLRLWVFILLTVLLERRTARFRIKLVWMIRWKLKDSLFESSCLANLIFGMKISRNGLLIYYKGGPLLKIRHRIPSLGVAVVLSLLAYKKRVVRLIWFP